MNLINKNSELIDILSQKNPCSHELFRSNFTTFSLVPVHCFTTNQSQFLKRKGFHLQIKMMRDNEWVVISNGLSTMNAVSTCNIVSFKVCSICLIIIGTFE